MKMNPFGKRAGELVGLTGGAGSGKSEVSAQLQKLGARLIDADRLSREVCAKDSPGLKSIVKRFGKTVLLPDGSLDRKKLGAIVFADRSKRRALERIVHPLMLRKARQMLNGCRSGRMPRITVFDAPLLYEAGLDRFIDRVIVVWAPKVLQVERMARRDGMEKADALRRIRAQLPSGLKRKKADFVIVNSGDRKALKKQVKKLWRVLTNRRK